MTEKIVITNPIHDEVRMRLEQLGEVVVNDSLEPWSNDVLAQHLTEATALMGFMTDQIDASVLQHAPKLKIVACALKGFDNYDVSACTDKGIWISIVPDLLTEPTAELAMGLAISLGRHVLQGDHLIRNTTFKGWRAQLYGTGLYQSVVAIVGLGLVGQAIAQRLMGFGCKEILGVDPSSKLAGITSCTLSEALSCADYVFFAVPLTKDSRHLLDERQLALCKPRQLIINVGRGSVVDEEAVAQALEQNRLGGYAADVFACEDWALENRPNEIGERLIAHPRTVFTPHLGSAVRATRIAIEHRAADNIVAVLCGQAPPDAANTVKS